MKSLYNYIRRFKHKRRRYWYLYRLLDVMLMQYPDWYMRNGVSVEDNEVVRLAMSHSGFRDMTAFEFNMLIDKRPELFYDLCCDFRKHLNSLDNLLLLDEL